MGGIFSPKMPSAPVQAARAITAVQKTPDIEFGDEDTPMMGIKKKKKGKRDLVTPLDTSLQTASSGSGLQITKGA